MGQKLQFACSRKVWGDILQLRCHSIRRWVSAYLRDVSISRPKTQIKKPLKYRNSYLGWLNGFCSDKFHVSRSKGCRHEEARFPKWDRVIFGVYTPVLITSSCNPDLQMSIKPYLWTQTCGFEILAISPETCLAVLQGSTVPNARRPRIQACTILLLFFIPVPIPIELTRAIRSNMPSARNR